MFDVKEAVKLVPVFLPSDSTYEVTGGKAVRQSDGSYLVTFETGKTTLSLVGSDLDETGAKNKIVGATGKANETIIGGAGDDTIFGGKGVDVYTGGAGADIFGLVGKKHQKFIMDFSGSADNGEGDKILLRDDKAVFKRIGERIANGENFFKTVSSKRQLLGRKKDVIGYNQTNGKLFVYNAQKGTASCIAQFVPGTQVTKDDIIVGSAS